jgi:hypothetical protein
MRWRRPVVLALIVVTRLLSSNRAAQHPGFSQGITSRSLHRFPWATCPRGAGV